MRELKVAWRERLGSVRTNSTTDLLLRALPGAPILTVKSAESLVGRSKVAVNEAVRRLTDAGVMTQVTVGSATAPSKRAS